MTDVIFKDGSGYALLDDGEVLPVTNMYDCDGDECDDFWEATVVVAGPDKDGMWVTIGLSGEESGGRLN